MYHESSLRPRRLAKIYNLYFYYSYVSVVCVCVCVYVCTYLKANLASH